MKLNYSIIIPHRNSPELLDRCLRSIPQREDIEIIVVDDNSDANQKPIISRSDVQLILLEEDSPGAGRARNKGLDRAKGKWLLFADCDDFYEKGFIDELDKFVESSYDIIYFDMHYSIDLASGECWPNPYSHQIEDFLKDPLNINKKKILKFSKTEPWHQMYSHQFISSINVSFHEVPIVDDAWFTQYAASQTNNIYAIDKKLYYWVRNSTSQVNKKHSFETYKIVEKERLLIKKMKAKEGVWITMNPFWRELGRLGRTNGLLFAFRILFLRLSNGIIEWRIIWEKYFKMKKNE